MTLKEILRKGLGLDEGLRKVRTSGKRSLFCKNKDKVLFFKFYFQNYHPTRLVSLLFLQYFCHLCNISILSCFVTTKNKLSPWSKDGFS